MIEQIIFDDCIIAIIIHSDFNKAGIHFFTPDDFSQQLAYMNHDKGKIIQPHIHNPVSREVQYTQEVLFIKTGKIRVDFFSNEQKYIKSRILKTGDVILLSTGGHGFEMLEPTEMFEVKQGPYAGELDKMRFNSEITNPNFD